MAQAMGVNGSKIEDPTEIAGAVEKAYASGKPALLDISIDGSL
jgi:thiamine pyrophosphate-dependent acetolactate synthase large subunit-like protein